MFVRKFRGSNNVLGAAVQLSTLPWLGFVPDEVASAPGAAVSRLADRLGLAVGVLDDYGVREQTRTDHLRRSPGTGGGARPMKWSGSSCRSSRSPGRWRTIRRGCCSGWRVSIWRRCG